MNGKKQDAAGRKSGYGDRVLMDVMLMMMLAGFGALSVVISLLLQSLARAVLLSPPAPGIPAWVGLLPCVPAVVFAVVIVFAGWEQSRFMRAPSTGFRRLSVCAAFCFLVFFIAVGALHWANEGLLRTQGFFSPFSTGRLTVSVVSGGVAAGLLVATVTLFLSVFAEKAAGAHVFALSSLIPYLMSVDLMRFVRANASHFGVPGGKQSPGACLAGVVAFAILLAALWLVTRRRDPAVRRVGLLGLGTWGYVGALLVNSAVFYV